MRLERVTIEGFGPLAGFEALMEPKRLNLFIGPNESGKSSFASAIVSALFGCASAEQEERLKPWSGARHKVAVTFTTAGGRFRVTREFGTHQVVVDRLKGDSDEVDGTVFRGVANPRGRSAEQLQYEEVLRGWFGFTEARLFRESSFVHENALETQVSPELRHLVSGAVEADYQQIEDALMDRLDLLTREHPYDPRARKRANRSIENRIERIRLLKERKSRSESVLTELKSRQDEREALEKRFGQTRAELADKEKLLVALETWLKLREEQRQHLKRAPEIGTELVTARRARNQTQEIDRRIQESLGYLANAPEEAESDLMRVGMLRAQRGRNQKAVEEERRKVTKPPPKRSPLPVILLGIALGAIAGGGAWFAFQDYVMAGGAAVAGIVAGLALGAILTGRNGRSPAMSETHARVLEENIRTLSEEINAIEIKVNPFLAGRTIEVVTEDLKRYKKMVQERREAAAVIHSLPTPERLEAESKEIDEAVASLRSKEKLLLQQSPFLAPLKSDPVKAAEAAERLKREAGVVRTRLSTEQEAFDGFMRRAGGLDGDAENLESLDESIASEEEALTREERQRDALLMALEVLRDSVITYQQEHVHRLAHEAEETLGRLTDGRYTKVRLDSDFRPTLSTGDRDGIALEALSRGARDAFYLALRASLARELAAREPLPLILDDPIAHFDEERRGVLLAMLEDLASENQVILLTHDRRVLNQVREAHVLGVGTSHKNRDLTKVQVRP